MNERTSKWNNMPKETKFGYLVDFLNQYPDLTQTPKEWARTYMREEPNSSDKNTTSDMLNYLYFLGYVSKTPQYNQRVDGNIFGYRLIKKIQLRKKT